MRIRASSRFTRRAKKLRDPHAAMLRAALRRFASDSPRPAAADAQAEGRSVSTIGPSASTTTCASSSVGTATSRFLSTSDRTTRCTEPLACRALDRQPADTRPAATVGRMDPEAILAGLNDEQREAATATTGPVVILAGAGTGKTRVISHRVAYAAATQAVDPKQALVVTFTEKAAAEMKARLMPPEPAAGGGLDLPCRRAPTAGVLLADRPRPTAARGARLEAADHRADGARPARRLSVHAGEGPGRRDRVGQGPPPDAVDLCARARTARSQGRLHQPLAPIRIGEAAGGPDRLRGHADPRGRAVRDRCGRAGARASALQLVQRRRVPGHESAPGGPAPAVARRAARPVRRRRPRPDDLHLHRRQQRLPDHLRGPIRRRARRAPERQLPQLSAGDRARQPPHPRPRAALDGFRWTDPGAGPLRRWRRRGRRGRRRASARCLSKACR